MVSIINGHLNLVCNVMPPLELVELLDQARNNDELMNNAVGE